MRVQGLESVAKAVCASQGFTFADSVGAGAFKQTFAVSIGSELAALKVFALGTSPARAKREIEAMTRCDHPNIASLKSVDVITHEGEVYLYSVEEYLAGGTLADVLNRDELLTHAQAGPMGRALISAVAHLEERQLVHRDIKPENIMLRSDERTPVIVDFGLARHLGQSSLTVSWLPQGPGTPFYAPAEQLLNDKALIDWRADQFSLGVTLSVLTLGVHPYANSPTQLPFDIIERVAARQSPSDLFISLSESAGMRALPKMVASWPVHRYRTPEELAAAWG